MTISDTALDLSAISPSVSSTLVTSLTIGVVATFSTPGSSVVSCTYSDSVVRSQLGTTIQDVAEFEVASAYSGKLSVDSSGTLTAIATHWAKGKLLDVRTLETSDGKKYLHTLTDRQSL